VAVGVNLPVQRADQTPLSGSKGGPANPIRDFTRVITAVPLKSGEMK
jgi:hypothetical protein